MAEDLRSTGRAVRLAALTVLLYATTAAAQPPAVDPIPKTGSGTTLYLVVRADVDVTEPQIVKTLEGGLFPSGHIIDGKPVIKPISPFFFEQFADLIGTPRPSTGGGTGSALNIGQLPSRDGTLTEVRMPNAKQTLTKLAVKYSPSEGKKDTEEYVPGQPGTGPLTLIEPGRYAFRPTAGRSPVSLTATYDERDETTKDIKTGQELTANWPSMNRYYVVTMNNFRLIDQRGGNRHNHENYLATVERQNSDAINPITLNRLGGDQLFVFANMADDADSFGIGIVNNDLVIRVNNTGRQKAQRVWVRFPLTDQQYKDDEPIFSTKATTDLPNEVRKNSVPLGKAFTIDTDTPPQWIEVGRDPNNPGMFSRTIPLKNLPGLAKKFPTVNQLTVWEGERLDGAGRLEREAIRIQNAQKKKVTAAGGPIEMWSTEMKRILAEPEKP